MVDRDALPNSREQQSSLETYSLQSGPVTAAVAGSARIAKMVVAGENILVPASPGDANELDIGEYAAGASTIVAFSQMIEGEELVAATDASSNWGFRSIGPNTITAHTQDGPLRTFLSYQAYSDYYFASLRVRLDMFNDSDTELRAVTEIPMFFDLTGGEDFDWKSMARTPEDRDLDRDRYSLRVGEEPLILVETVRLPSLAVNLVDDGRKLRVAARAIEEGEASQSDEAVTIPPNKPSAQLIDIKVRLDQQEYGQSNGINPAGYTVVPTGKWKDAF